MVKYCDQFSFYGEQKVELLYIEWPGFCLFGPCLDIDINVFSFQ